MLSVCLIAQLVVFAKGVDTVKKVNVIKQTLHFYLFSNRKNIGLTKNFGKY